MAQSVPDDGTSRGLVHTLKKGAAATSVCALALKGVVLGGLHMGGFTAAGPAAGSLAASWMSSLAVAGGTGGVAAGTTYATLQSFAMTTPLLGPLVVVPGAAAAALYGVPVVVRHAPAMGQCLAGMAVAGTKAAAEVSVGTAKYVHKRCCVPVVVRHAPAMGQCLAGMAVAGTKAAAQVSVGTVKYMHKKLVHSKL